ncbi:MAG: hypothetical protein FJ271_16185 [Planctomycetes bacterium]|nr:hypothetical protein [Planctomycetota bacterium]
MPFLAACPFCPAKMKLSRKRLGASVKCEQCGNHFTAVPPDDFAPGPSTFRQLRTGASPTVATATHVDKPATEATALVDGACPAAAYVPAQSHAPTLAIPGWINLWGLVSLLMTSAAMLFAASGLLRSLSIPLASAGLVICLAGIPLTPRRKAKDVAWLGMTAALAAAFLLVAFAWPHYLNRFWGMDHAVKSVDPATQFLASRNNQVPRGRELDGEAWVEADRHAVRQGDIHIRVEEVKIELDHSRETPVPRNSLITLRVSNMGQLRRIQYRSPGLAGQPPVLRDNRGKLYTLRNAGAGTSARSLKPLAHVQDQWTCEPIDAQVEHLELEVPASAWAGKGSCKFRIPRSMIAFQAKE